MVTQRLRKLTPWGLFIYLPFSRMVWELPGHRNLKFLIFTIQPKYSYMKLLMIALFVVALCSCNNSNDKQVATDSTSKTNAADTLKKISADTASNVYCYITGVEKMHDSIVLKADYVDYFTGPNVLEEAKKRHLADTSFDKRGKIQDIFVPDDYFIVNDDKTLRTLYLPAGSPITMDSELAGHPNHPINTYDYFSKHYQNSLFLLKVRKNNVESIKEIFLP